MKKFLASLCVFCQCLTYCSETQPILTKVETDDYPYPECLSTTEIQRFIQGFVYNKISKKIGVHSRIKTLLSVKDIDTWRKTASIDEIDEIISITDDALMNVIAKSKGAYYRRFACNFVTRDNNFYKCWGNLQKTFTVSLLHKANVTMESILGCSSEYCPEELDRLSHKNELVVIKHMLSSQCVSGYIPHDHVDSDVFYDAIIKLELLAEKNEEAAEFKMFLINVTDIRGGCPYRSPAIFGYKAKYTFATDQEIVWKSSFEWPSDIFDKP